jgi:hypothetical protein
VRRILIALGRVWIREPLVHYTTENDIR